MLISNLFATNPFCVVFLSIIYWFMKKHYPQTLKILYSLYWPWSQNKKEFSVDPCGTPMSINLISNVSVFHVIFE